MIAVFVYAMLLFSFIYGKTIYFVPIPGFAHEDIFYDQYSHRDEVMKPFFQLREHLENSGHQVKITYSGANLIDADFIISLCDINQNILRNLSSYPRGKCFLLIFEPPVTFPAIYQPSLSNIFGKIFTMFDDQIDSKNYFKLYYPQPRLEMISPVPDFYQKKLCTMVSGNKSSDHPQCIYKYRRDVVDFFEELNTDEFDLYGPSWEGKKNWKGTIPNKWEVLKQYKFSFCYENMGNQKGYVTEKIFDSFIGGCVPIYLGANNITEYVPPDCFIDRRNFSSNEDLYQFLRSMDKTTYDAHIAAIKKYLASAQANLYSIENFIRIIDENLN